MVLLLDTAEKTAYTEKCSCYFVHSTYFSE